MVIRDGNEPFLKSSFIWNLKRKKGEREGREEMSVDGKEREERERNLRFLVLALL